MVEIVIPFGLFLTEDIRALVGIIFIAFQFIIWLTGNLSYLNHLTVALSIITFNNFFLSPFYPPQVYSDLSNGELNLIISIVGISFSILQIIHLWNHFYPQKRRLVQVLNGLAPYHLVNRYGLFAVMTTERDEIIVEGSEDGENWKEYLCWYKPSEITRRPRRISPYQPRLDWQMWFLPFENFESATWFHLFLIHVLKGTPEVMKLIRFNPFPDKPPKYVRALMYEYQFSSQEEKRKAGIWWTRELKGLYSPVLTLRTSLHDEISDFH